MECEIWTSLRVSCFDIRMEKAVPPLVLALRARLAAHKRCDTSGRRGTRGSKQELEAGSLSSLSTNQARQGQLFKDFGGVGTQGSCILIDRQIEQRRLGCCEGWGCGDRALVVLRLIEEESLPPGRAHT